RQPPAPRRRPRWGPDDRRARRLGAAPRPRLGAHREPHLGRADGLPRRGVLRRGQGRARELHDERLDRAGRPGVTANVVYPPVTDTGWITPEVWAFVASSSDHVHIAQPSEVAEVVGWLCTDAARLVTGNVVRLR